MRQALIGGVIAVAAWAICGPAGATIADGSQGGNSELFLSVADESKKVSYFRDLGITFDQFLANPSQPYSFAPDANWSNFLAVPGIDSTNLIYNVAGLSTPGVNPRYLSTVQVGLDPTDPSNVPFSSLLSTSFPIVNSYVQDNNSLPNDQKNHSTHGTQLNGSNIAFSGDTPFAYFGDGFGRDWQGNAPFDSTQTIGNPLAFWLITEGSSPVGQADVQVEPGQWLLSTNGALTYGVASVPEEHSWAVLVCGLVAMAAFVRRRIS